MNGAGKAWLAALHLGTMLGCRTEMPAARPPQAAASPEAGACTSPWFVEVTAECGLDFVHAAAGAEQYFFPAIMAPGAALLDFNNDGRLDIFLLNGSPLPQLGVEEAQRAGEAPTRGNRLLRQQDDGRFQDVTAGSGLELEVYGMGVAAGDVNNDGWPDLYLSCYGPDRLLVNQRDGTFRDVTHEAGIDNPRWGASAAFFDFDRDGWLDVYVTNYVDYDPAQPCHGAGGRQDFCNPAVFPRTADRLFRNVTGDVVKPEADAPTAGAVRFEDVSLASGVARKAGAGLGVLCADLTGDGWQDVYVANDGHANFLWVNQQDGTFRDEAVILGAAYDALGRGQGSMGVALGDVNQDAVLDIVVTNLEGENNALYLGQSGPGFQESSASAGLGGSFPDTGFGTSLLDLENDGDLDLAIVNGRVRRSAAHIERDAAQRDPAEFWRPYVERNAILLNQGQGRFQPLACSDDPFLSQEEISRALAVGDVDNDGDLDLLVTQDGGRARLFRNQAPQRGHWLNVRAVDPRYGGRDAYGAVVTVAAGQKSWRQAVAPGASYLTTHDPRLHFGLGDVEQIDGIDVHWPDGTRETFPGGAVDEFRTLSFGEGDLP